VLNVNAEVDGIVLSLGEGGSFLWNRALRQMVGRLSGDYRISITDLPEGFYLKDACLSERDVFIAPLRPS